MQHEQDNARMHCPSCGTQAPLKQKFCRSCGFNLETITHVFAKQVASPELMLKTKKLQERQQLIERSLLVAGGAAGAVVCASFYTGIIYLMAVGNMPLVPGVILLLLLTIAVIAGSLATYSAKLRQRLSQSEAAGLKLPPDEASALSSADEPPLFSITERTTNLLESNLEGATQRKEGGV
jgi:hypothetical protein